MSNNKLFSIFILCLLLITSCSNKKNDWIRYGLKGQVKSLTDKVYKAKESDGNWVKVNDKPEEYIEGSFTEDGLLKSNIIFDENEKLNFRFELLYEDNKIKEELFYNQDDKVITRSVYNELSPEIIEFKSYDEDNKLSNDGKSYFENNRVVKQSLNIYNSYEIQDKFTITFQYDKDGNLIKHKQVNVEGESLFNREYKFLEFDDKNNWTKRVEFDKVENKERISIREISYF